MYYYNNKINSMLSVKIKSIYCYINNKITLICSRKTCYPIVSSRNHSPCKIIQPN